MHEELHINFIKLRTNWVGSYCSEYADDSFGEGYGLNSDYCTVLQDASEH